MHRTMQDLSLEVILQAVMVYAEALSADAILEGGGAGARW